ncbi:hypothetical protein [Calothrix rhizosoleniae]|uniref:hypothetical protein n=1 Tax=Calothrix rhizosoleniae TaxID=888997 RepID=UPI000B4987C3|nr:hypothetical protein [Calothrix rhizosoleniae]
MMNSADCEIIQLENYQLHLCYEELGTRSEGQRGTLWLAGQEIPGKKGDKLTIGAVTLRHYGTERPVTWAITGWNYDDSSLIKNSWER